MNIKKYLSNNKITQIFFSNENFHFFKSLKEYENLKENTIFICCNDFDINFINFHKGKKWVFFILIMILKILNK